MILKKDNVERIIPATSIGIIAQLCKEGWAVVPETPLKDKSKRKARKEVGTNGKRTGD